MKKYTTFPGDFSTVATESMAYLNSITDVENSEHHTQAFHYLGNSDTVLQLIPSLVGATNGLTILDCAHLTVNRDAMFNHIANRDILFVPLEDCESTVLHLFSVSTDAVINVADNCYDDADCTITDTVPLTGPILIASGSVFTIESDSMNTLSDVLQISFVEDTSSYLV